MSLCEIQNIIMIIKNDVLDRLGHIVNTIASPKLIFQYQILAESCPNMVDFGLFKELLWCPSTKHPWVITCGKCLDFEEYWTFAQIDCGNEFFIVLSVGEQNIEQLGTHLTLQNFYSSFKFNIKPSFSTKCYSRITNLFSLSFFEIGSHDLDPVQKDC